MVDYLLAVAALAVVAFGIFLGAIGIVLVKIQQVHVLVNSRLSEALDRIDQLGDTLKDRGIDLPRDPHER